MRLWIFLVAVALFLWEYTFFENVLEKIEFLYNTKSIYIVGYYTIVTFVGFFALSLLFFVRSRSIYVTSLTIMLVGYMVDLIYKNINRVGFSLNDLAVVIAEADKFALDALRAYAEAIKEASVTIAIFLFLAVILRAIIKKENYFVSARVAIGSLVVALLHLCKTPLEAH